MQSPASTRSKCALCAEPIDNINAPGVYQRTSGWVQRRDGGGGHAISLPERSPQWAHGYCVRAMVEGHWGQESLGIDVDLVKMPYPEESVRPVR